MNLTSVHISACRGSFWKYRLFVIFLFFIMMLPSFFLKFLVNFGNSDGNWNITTKSKLFSHNGQQLVEAVVPKLLCFLPGNPIFERVLALFGKFVHLFSLMYFHQVIPVLAIVALTLKHYVEKEFVPEIDSSYGNVAKVKPLTVIEPYLFYLAIIY